MKTHSSGRVEELSKESGSTKTAKTSGADLHKQSHDDSEKVATLKTRLRELESRLRASRMIQGDDEGFVSDFPTRRW